MSAAAPEIAVVIPTYNRSARVLPLLESLAAQTLPASAFEVIVVDDCSTDDTREVIEKAAADLPYRLRVQSTPYNHGPAAARNVGWQTTDAPYVAFTDDDCEPSAQWLSAGLRALRLVEAPGVVQGSTLIPEGTPVDQLLDWNVHRYVAGPTPWYEGCNLFFRRDVLDVTGGFDEDIRYYGEDCAAGWRVTEAGYRRAFEADAAVTHAVEPRGFGWYIRNGYLESRLVHCASLHEGFRRDAFWRPWSVRKEGFAFVLALVAVFLGRRFRPALLLALPYLWWQRPSMRRRTFFRMCLQVPLVDAARLAGHLKGSIDHHVFVV